MARAAFAEAARRGSLPELVMAFLDSVGEEDRELYREWLALPSPEDLQRQVANADVLITPPDLESFLPQRVIVTRTM